MKTPTFWRFSHVTVVRVTDGDTLHVNIDLGWFINIRVTLRLYGINAYETKGISKKRGLAAKAYLTQLLPPGTPIVLDTLLDTEKYGRTLAKVWKDTLNINDDMLARKHAKVALYD